MSKAGKIDAFYLGGAVPLAAVGPVLAAIFEHGGKPQDVAPIIEGVANGKHMNGRLGRQVNKPKMIEGPKEAKAPEPPAQSAKKLSPLHQAILSVIKPEESLTMDQIFARVVQAGIKTTDGSVRQCMTPLTQNGHMIRTGVGLYALPKHKAKESALAEAYPRDGTPAAVALEYITNHDRAVPMSEIKQHLENQEISVANISTFMKKLVGHRKVERNAQGHFKRIAA